MISEKRMLEVEDYFLKHVNTITGFARRTDGRIERQVPPRETGIKRVKGEFFPQAEIIDDGDFLFYINGEITAHVQYRVEEEEAAN